MAEVLMGMGVGLLISAAVYLGALWLGKWAGRRADEEFYRIGLRALNRTTPESTDAG